MLTLEHLNGYLKPHRTHSDLGIVSLSGLRLAEASTGSAVKWDPANRH